MVGEGGAVGAEGENLCYLEAMVETPQNRVQSADKT